MNHISILYHDQIILANHVVRDGVIKYNYHLKKEPMILLLRCRYTEIIQNFDTILNVMLQNCKKMRIKRKFQLYYNCMAELSIIIYRSEHMFRIILKVIEKLK